MRIYQYKNCGASGSYGYSFMIQTNSRIQSFTRYCKRYPSAEVVCDSTCIEDRRTYTTLILKLD
jgi:hypothetical protein